MWGLRYDTRRPEITGRVCCGIEFDPKYMICQRWAGHPFAAARSGKWRRTFDEGVFGITGLAHARIARCGC